MKAYTISGVVYINTRKRKPTNSDLSCFKTYPECNPDILKHLPPPPCFSLLRGKAPVADTCCNLIRTSVFLDENLRYPCII